jgi:hypothetical protein
MATSNKVAQIDMLFVKQDTIYGGILPNQTFFVVNFTLELFWESYILLMNEKTHPAKPGVS